MSNRNLSKFLSLILRHKPASVGLTLDAAGWVEVDKLLATLNERGRSCDRQALETVVADNNKQRFEFSADGNCIRARQGHSVEVELGYTPQEPPEFLFHGTSTDATASIRAQGLEKRSRHAVHLSSNKDTANNVGGRHGKPIVLCVHAKALAGTGVEFFLTDNGVWLTDTVPPSFIDFPENAP